MISYYLTDRKIINSLCIIFFTILVIYSAIAYSNHKNDYTEQTHHISVRNYSAAKWINENTPENSVIATHDIGAIGYYTKRRIVDVAGLISPQFTPKLFDPDFSKFMVEEMKRQNVFYMAFMREWYTAVNQNPVFEAGDDNSEIIAIYKFDKERTHILSRDVNYALQMGMEMISNKKMQQAQSVFAKTIEMDPLSSPAYYYLAYTYSLMNNPVNSEKYLLKALDIFPGYREAILALADTYKKQNKISEEKIQLDKYLKNNPSDSTVYKLLNSLLDTTRTAK